MAELRGKIDTISSNVANSVEACRPFKGNEEAYGAWLEKHATNGHILHRDTAAAKTAYLHSATCPKVIGEEPLGSAKSPKVGCPTKAAALAFALRKKWKVVSDCPECTPAAV